MTKLPLSKALLWLTSLFSGVWLLTFSSYGQVCVDPCYANGAILADSLPQRWQLTEQCSQASPSEDKWWAAWQDPLLSDLIERGEKNNYNLLAAIKRIEIGRLAVKENNSAYWPTLQTSGSWSYEQIAGRTSGKNVPSQRTHNWSLGLSASWEIDVFGRVAAGAKEKKAAWQASKAEYLGVMNSLAAQIALNYIDLREQQAVRQVIEANVESQEKIVKITEARKEAGISSALDVAQAKMVLYSTEATLPSVDGAIREDINNIATLLGVYPHEIEALLTVVQPLPDYQRIVNAGVPAELLRRRPDIVEAEYNLAEAMAAVGVAKKDFLPSLSLTGMIATESRDITGMFGKNSLSWSVQPTISWTIFDGFARNYRTQAAKLQSETAIDNYNQTVMSAVQEVNNAMISYDSAIQNTRLLSKVIEQSEKSFELSLDLYKKGLNPFTDVMNSQEQTLEYQNQLVSAKGAALKALVQLYQSLGGGLCSSDY